MIQDKLIEIGYGEHGELELFVDREKLKSLPQSFKVPLMNTIIELRCQIVEFLDKK